MDAFSVLMQAGLGRLALATLQSLPLAGLVWVLCRALPRLGAAARCWLWWLVALQLVLGLCWPSPLRLPLLPATDTQVSSAPATPAQAMAADFEPPGVSIAPAGVVTAGTVAAAPVAPVTGRAPAWMAWTLWFAWLTGVAMMALRSLADLRVTRNRLRASSAAVPPAIAAQYRELSTRLGLHQPPPLRLCAQLDSPQLAGVWSPHLLLPAHLLPQMSAAAIEMALHHELVHWQRRDLFWGWVPALAQHLFFFHPLAHVAAREYALAREAACDAAVLEGNRHAPQDYGRLLLQFGVA
ncbi:MAG TPA: M56 family metallopeptidase, partial [Stenotrophomonas sp.]|nr:M56 family metallopeptidase [Stenotrophomonas sp.]